MECVFVCITNFTSVIWLISKWNRILIKKKCGVGFGFINWEFEIMHAYE